MNLRIALRNWLLKPSAAELSLDPDLVVGLVARNRERIRQVLAGRDEVPPPLSPRSLHCALIRDLARDETGHLVPFPRGQA